LMTRQLHLVLTLDFFDVKNVLWHIICT
jgi:hypothetical protein